MRLSYDPEVDALYIRFLDAPMEVTTHRLSEDVAVNFAPDGRVVGIEVLDAANYVFLPNSIGAIKLDNLVPILA